MAPYALMFQDSDDYCEVTGCRRPVSQRRTLLQVEKDAEDADDAKKNAVRAAKLKEMMILPKDWGANDRSDSDSGDIDDHRHWFGVRMRRQQTLNFYSDRDWWYMSVARNQLSHRRRLAEEAQVSVGLIDGGVQEGLGVPFSQMGNEIGDSDQDGDPGRGVEDDEDEFRRTHGRNRSAGNPVSGDEEQPHFMQSGIDMPVSKL